MGRKSLKDIRQKEIIEVFYIVARREGLENTSIAKIASEMGTNPSLIIHYFKTKEDLTNAFIRYILDKYLDLFDIRRPLANPAADLERVMDNMFSSYWNSLIDDSLFYSAYALTFRNSTARQAFKKVLDGLRDKLAELLDTCKTAGVLELEDSRETADLIFVLLDGAYSYLCLVEDPNEYEEKMRYYKARAVGLLHMRKE